MSDKRDDTYDETLPPTKKMTMVAVNGEVISASLDGRKSEEGGGEGSSHSTSCRDSLDASASGATSESMVPLPLDDSPAPPPKVEAGIVASPEPPRWRFVNKAKKTLGYSSTAAGTVVKGLSAEELAGTFNAPQRKAMGGSTAENVDETAVELHTEANGQEKKERSVGRLDVQEGSKAAEETFVGMFRGHGRTAEAEDKEPQDARVSYDSSAKPGKEVTKITPPDILDELDQVEKQIMKTGRPPTSVPSEPTPHTSSKSSNREPSEGLGEPPEVEQGPKKKWAMLLVLLLLVTSAVILVATLNDRPPEESGSKQEPSSQKILPWENDNGALNAPTSAPTCNVTSQRGHFAVWVG